MRITVFFAVFWLCGLSISLEWGNSEVVLLAVVTVLVFGFRLARNNRWRSMAISLFLFVLAALYGSFVQSHNISKLPETGAVQLEGTIASPITIDGDRVRFVFQLSGQLQEKLAVTIKLDRLDELEIASQWQRGIKAVLMGELSLPAKARNFGQFDYSDYLSRKQMHRMLRVEGLKAVEIIPIESLSIQRTMGWIEGYRQQLSKRISELFPDEQAGFMSGMLIGVREDLSEALYNQFSRLGLTHIIAISGLHVAVVMGGLFLLLRICRVTTETAQLSALLLIPPYILLSGASPSVVRAGLMAMVAIYAIRRGWMKDAMQIMSLTLIALTLWNPYMLYDIGLQLSYLVTAGLIVFVPVFRKLLPAKPQRIHDAVAVTAVAQIVSFPLTVYYFNQFSLLSLIANFTLVPLFSLVALPIGYIALVGSTFYLPVGVWAAKPAVWCNELCFWIIEQLDAIPGFRLIWSSPPISALIIYYVIIAAIAWGVERYMTRDPELFPHIRRSGIYMLSGSLLALLIWLTAIYGLEEWGKAGKISFIDVGQGDSILIRSPQDRIILIDGGGTVRFLKPSETWRSGKDPYEVGKDLLLPLLKKRGVRRIDYMIATHSDADHIGGLLAVIEEIPVKRLLFNGTLKDTPGAKQLFAAALAHNIPLYAVFQGQMVEVDAYTSLHFLYPTKMEKISYEVDQNGSSVVSIMQMYGRRFLFTGDVDAVAEKGIVESLQPSDEINSGVHGGSGYDGSGGRDPGNNTNDSSRPIIDVLKVAHHGSKTSTSELWLDYWKPRSAVISVGARNSYRHPSAIVTDRLSDKMMPVFRTDVHGEIQFMLDERGMHYRLKFPASTSE